MNREIIEFDLGYFRNTVSDWQIDVRGRAGASGITGSGQVIYGSQPRWIAKLDFWTLRRADLVLSWRAVMDQMEGRINALRVHLVDGVMPTPAQIGSDHNGLPLPNEDGTMFSDGAGYMQSITATVLEDAVPGATTLRIDAGELGDALSGGHFFSISDWLYRATRVDGVGADAQLFFRMPLRRAVSAGTEINVGDPTALMTLEGDLEGAAALRRGNDAKPALRLVEWVGPGRP